MIDAPSVVVSTPPPCPICGTRATSTREVAHDGYTEGYYLDGAGHSWLTRWFVPQVVA